MSILSNPTIRLLTIPACILSFHAAMAQNLVPNGDLEQFTGCPTALEQLDSATYWFNPSDSGITLAGTPDYLNQCAVATLAHVPSTFIGYQPARSGVGYAGISLYHQSIADYREYMEVPLIAPLVPGTCYYFEMYVNLGNGCRYTTNKLQAYLSDTLISDVGSYYPLPFTPQLPLSAAANFDTLSWQKLSMTFTAAGGESYLLIGNFFADTLTAVTLTNPAGFGAYVYCFVEDVSLSPCVGMQPGSGQTPSAYVYPNPAGARIRISSPGFPVENLQIFSMAGVPVLYWQGQPEDWIDTSSLMPGIYLIVADAGHAPLRARFIVR